MHSAVIFMPRVSLSFVVTKTWTQDLTYVVLIYSAVDETCFRNITRLYNTYV